MIKLVSINDIDSFNELGLKLKSNFSELFKLNELLDSEYNYVFGYYIDNELVAFLHVQKSFEVVDIVNIVVSDKHLRCGIACALLNYAFNYFNDVDKYLLEVKVTNDAAINLYKKNGFTIINIREKYYDGVDAYIMERSI